MFHLTQKNYFEKLRKTTKKLVEVPSAISFLKDQKKINVDHSQFLSSVRPKVFIVQKPGGVSRKFGLLKKIQTLLNVSNSTMLMLALLLGVLLSLDLLIFPAFFYPLSSIFESLPFPLSCLSSTTSVSPFPSPFLLLKNPRLTYKKSPNFTSFAEISCHLPTFPLLSTFFSSPLYNYNIIEMCYLVQPCIYSLQN